MRDFNFKAEYQKLLTSEVVAYLTQIHEYKGQQNLFIEAKADALSNLLEVAKIQSTEASNRIEGIITTDDRLKKIVREKTMPQSRSEKEIAGYRDVLATIHESHDYIPPKPTVILQLLTLLLLYRSGYIVGKYISIEKLISDTKETYYEALQASSYNWHEGTNDYAPFVTYMLGILTAAYRDFESRIELLTTKGLSKPDRVREIIKNHLGKITKSEIMAKCPDISQITVQRALAELLKNGEITKLSGGRYTAYVWSGEEML